ncbi:c-type cytochrome [Litoreibacter arenae]|uniref:Cytochrome c-554 n=1 Tax=Litoreibacter arenae DSM 19593 TaxID=1123360 RepID=S9RM03_9RHOB|nr:cytochrome c [Litoreibacter arenae]EPX79105.1 cytochrome c-554 [Litoreibacter arenae DSM 19593]
MKLTRVLATAGLAAGLISTMAFADGHNLPAEVKARNGLMANYSLYLGILGDMAKGEREYNEDLALTAAKNLAAFAATDQSLLWPEGTDTMSIDGTRALPKIWEDRADFDAKADDLDKAASAMAQVTDIDLEAIQVSMKDLGGACSACHKPYREPE